jgi:valyl-tRNA synthetase
VTRSVLIHLRDSSMRLLHPICPFISEEIWQNLPLTNFYRDQGIDFCAVAPFPKQDITLIDQEAEHMIELIFDVSTMIKNGRQSSDLPVSLPLPVKLFAKDADTKSQLIAHQDLISHLSKTSRIDILIRGQEEIKELSVINSSNAVDVVILLKGLIDAEKELARLNHALEKIATQKDNLEKRLANLDFVNNAPQEIVQHHKDELAAITEKQEQLNLGKKRLLNAQ